MIYSYTKLLIIVLAIISFTGCKQSGQPNLGDSKRSQDKQEEFSDERSVSDEDQLPRAVESPEEEPSLTEVDALETQPESDPILQELYRVIENSGYDVTGTEFYTKLLGEVEEGQKSNMTQIGALEVINEHYFGHRHVVESINSYLEENQIIDLPAGDRERIEAVLNRLNRRIEVEFSNLKSYFLFYSDAAVIGLEFEYDKDEQIVRSRLDRDVLINGNLGWVPKNLRIIPTNDLFSFNDTIQFIRSMRDGVGRLGTPIPESIRSLRIPGPRDDSIDKEVLDNCYPKLRSGVPLDLYCDLAIELLFNPAPRLTTEITPHLLDHYYYKVLEIEDRDRVLGGLMRGASRITAMIRDLDRFLSDEYRDMLNSKRMMISNARGLYIRIFEEEAIINDIEIVTLGYLRGLAADLSQYVVNVTYPEKFVSKILKIKASQDNIATLLAAGEIGRLGPNSWADRSDAQEYYLYRVSGNLFLITKVSE